uniref:Death domain-containing protein n=1 Tax=Syphacia muris TaxID=451379 RepID=A0A158R536_9BILA
MEIEQLCKSPSCCSLSSTLSSSSSWSVIAESQEEVIAYNAADDFLNERSDNFLDDNNISKNLSSIEDNESHEASSCYSQSETCKSETDAEVNCDKAISVPKFDNTVSSAECDSNEDDEACSTSNSESESEDMIMVNDEGEEITSHHQTPLRKDFQCVKDDFAYTTVKHASSLPKAISEPEIVESSLPIIKLYNESIKRVKAEVDFTFLSLVNSMCSEKDKSSNEKCYWSAWRMRFAGDLNDESRLRILKRFFYKNAFSKPQQKLKVVAEKARAGFHYIKNRLNTLKERVRTVDFMSYVNSTKSIANVIKQLKYSEEKMLDALHVSLSRLESLSKSFQQSWVRFFLFFVEPIALICVLALLFGMARIFSWRNILRWSAKPSHYNKEVESRYPNLNYDCIALIELANSLNKDAVLQRYIGKKNAEEYLNKLYDIASCNEERISCEFCFWSGGVCENGECHFLQWQKNFDTSNFIMLNERVLNKPFSKLKWFIGKPTTCKKGNQLRSSRQVRLHRSEMAKKVATVLTNNLLSETTNTSVLQLPMNYGFCDRVRDSSGSKFLRRPEIPIKRAKSLSYWEKLANLESTREYGLREWVAEVLQMIHIDGIELTLSMTAETGFAKWKNRLESWEHLVNIDSTREYALNRWIEEVLKIKEKGMRLLLKAVS